MQYRFFILSFSVFFLMGCNRHAGTTSSGNECIRFDRPARVWEETLPLGNGRLGLMPDGGIRHERIVLNEISLWSGSEADYDNPEASRSLPEIRRLLFAGKNQEAQELMYRTFVPRMPKGDTYGTYQLLGHLDIRYRYPAPPDTSGYSRNLQLNEGIALTSFGQGRYRREYFASRPEDIMVVHLEQPVPCELEVSLSRPEKAHLYKEGEDIVMEGMLDSGQPGTDGVNYIVRLSGRAEDGPEGGIRLTDSSLLMKTNGAATLFISAATDYRNPDYRKQAVSRLEKGKKLPYRELRQNHTDAHGDLYERVEVSIGHSGDSVTNLTTPRRIERFTCQDDPALAALYLQYGRYLLISSARPGCLPPNLQGLWANTIRTPWNGDYHTNINIQMNHWPLEPGNLSVLYEPLITLTRELVASGEKTARTFYGSQARGWVLHMMTNPWRYTVPGEHPSWGATNTGGAWLCAHLWEHYLYNGDTAYLRQVYPVLKGAADFFLSTMVREPAHGWLVTAPASSPENEFYAGNDPTPVSVCMGPTMDIQLIRELWGNVRDAARILGTDSLWCRQLDTAYNLLPPHRISPEGYLMEWLEDYKETDIHHRHVSHLYGLYPGNQITPASTPELAEACRKTLERRGDAGTGWSRAWKINFWARLQDGNRAYKLFHSLLTPALCPDGSHQGGSFPNLFCSHPPFQIDGNFGGAAGVMEMLLQSHAGYLDLLPAIPDSWDQGYFKGLRARGGITAGLTWQEHRPRTLTLCALRQNSCRLKLPQGVKRVTVDERPLETEGKAYAEIPLAAGHTVKVKFRY